MDKRKERFILRMIRESNTKILGRGTQKNERKISSQNWTIERLRRVCRGKVV
jgi:hypothetical protein